MLQVLVRILVLSQGVQFLKQQFKFDALVRQCYKVAKHAMDFCDGDESEALSIVLVFASRYSHHMTALGDEQIKGFVLESAKAVEGMREELDQVEFEPEEEKIPELEDEDSDEDDNEDQDDIKSWDETLMSTFEISPQAKKALSDAGLLTIRDVLTFVASGEDLAALKGVSSTAAKLILDQIASMKPAEGSE